MQKQYSAECNADARPNVGRARQRIVLPAVLVVSAPLLAGCLSDPPAAPEVQPLEIIATSSVKPDKFCLLNVDEVGAGHHEVYLISEQGPADVRVIDPEGKVILEESVEPQILDEEPPQELPAHEVPEIPVLRLAKGIYRIECMPDGQPMSAAELRVVSARPGFEDIQPDR